MYYEVSHGEFRMSKSKNRLSDRQLLDILALTPVATAIYTSDEFIIESVNDYMLEAWNLHIEVTGMRLKKVLAEGSGNTLIDNLTRVWATGLPFNSTSDRQKTGPEIRLIPLKNSQGIIYGILHTQGVQDKRMIFENRTDNLHTAGPKLNDAILPAVISRGHSTSEQLKEEPTDIGTKQLLDFFMHAPALIYILDGPDMIYQLVNQSYQRLFSDRELLGKPILEILPEIKGLPVEKILNSVYETGETYWAKELKLSRPEFKGGPLVESWYNFTFQARLTEGGKVDGILVFAFEVSDFVLARRQLQENIHTLNSLVKSAHYGIAILKGSKLIVEAANIIVTDIWDRNLSDVIGKPLLEILPEIHDQPFPLLLQSVMETGIPYGQKEVLFTVETQHGPKNKFVSFFYDPIYDSSGNITGIITSAEDVSEQVHNRQLVEQVNNELQAMNEELRVINEELEDSNLQLIRTNRKLFESKENLEKTMAQLEESESRFRQSVNNAPIAICILNGKNLVIETINEMMLNIWGKTNEILNMPLRRALPEMHDQHFINMLDKIFISGKTYSGNEQKAMLIHNGKLKEFYLSYIYKPQRDRNGKVISIMVVTIDVTEQVKAREDLLTAEGMLKFTIEAASIGTWSLNLKTYIPSFSGRQKELYGFNEQDEIGTRELIDQVEPEYRIESERLMMAVIEEGGTYDMTFPVTGFHDQKIRWIRALGSRKLDDKGIPSFFSGVSIETTEQKQDELRKNHFINIVSHELKTPLTSLKGYIQLLAQKAENTDDKFLTSFLDKADMKIDKMTGLINGFLNVSQLESGKIKLSLQEFNLEELVKEMAGETNKEDKSHHIHFIPYRKVMIEADRQKIGQVIANLLNNAAKYSPLKSDIEIGCQLQEGLAVVSIKDHGIGISAEDQLQIFNRYFRVESDENSQISGFGIGLYLCQEILQRHNGTLSVQSVPDEGSTFFFSLPLSKASYN